VCQCACASAASPCDCLKGPGVSLGRGSRNVQRPERVSQRLRVPAADDMTDFPAVRRAVHITYSFHHRSFQADILYDLSEYT
jgi:hypothetical protein